MTATVLRDPELLFITDPDGTEAEVDLSAYTRSVGPTSEAETLDIATFGNTRATEIGRVTDELTITFLWEPDLYTALLPMIGDELEMRFKPNKSDTAAITARIRFAALPWDEFVLGQAAEVQLATAVLTAFALTPDA